MNVPVAPLFFSTFPYAACKRAGAAAWPDTVRWHLTHLDESDVLGFRTLGQAGRIAHCEAYVDASTYITRARCVAAGHFLRKQGKDCDVWLTCDDDVYASKDVIAQIVTACRATRGLVALPYMNRDGESMTFRRVTAPTVWAAQVPLRAVDRVGMGLCAMHRSFVKALDDDALHFEDGYPFIFGEGVTDVDSEGRGIWTGEDYWLCQLAEAHDLPMHVILNAPGVHENLEAMLDLEGRMMVRGEAERARLEAGIERKNRAEEARTAKHARPSSGLVQCTVCRRIYAGMPEKCCDGANFLEMAAPLPPTET